MTRHTVLVLGLAGIAGCKALQQDPCEKAAAQIRGKYADCGLSVSDDEDTGASESPECTDAAAAETQCTADCYTAADCGVFTGEVTVDWADPRWTDYIFCLTDCSSAGSECQEGDTDCPVVPECPADTGSQAHPDFALVPASTFDMGCTPNQPYCDPDQVLHSVTLTHTYEVGATEVTQAEFQTTMGYNPSTFSTCGATCPVETVSWHEAAAYTNAVSRAAGLAECYTCTGESPAVQCVVAADPYTCAGYRLLTEAEWEGAARCGTDLRYAGSDAILDVGWVTENSCATTHPVAELVANACGLYDLSGNVHEWTQDWYGALSTSAATDPTGADPTAVPPPSERVFRDGAWSEVGVHASVAFRYRTDPARGWSTIGFRLARTSPN